MVVAQSATMTVDPPAVKKRGRPRKVVDENAAAPEKPAGVRKASTKAKATPKAKTMDAMKEKKKTLTKVSDYKTKKATVAPDEPPAQTTTAQQATPVTPTSSKILDEVRATGTFSKSSAAPKVESTEPFIPPVPGPAPVAPILPGAEKAPIASAEPAPVSDSTSPASAEAEQGFIPPVPGPAPVAPIQQPIDDAPSKPIIPPTASAPSERANIIPPKPRATTIPLPRKPLTAPSPTSEPAKPRVAFAEPAPRAPPRAPRYPARIIEPTPNTKLPPKYKKAARQVTSIIVGIPIIIVVGYELYGRWKTQINTKFEERARREGPQLSG